MSMIAHRGIIQARPASEIPILILSGVGRCHGSKRNEAAEVDDLSPSFIVFI